MPHWLPPALIAAAVALAALLLLAALRGRQAEHLARLSATLEALAASQERLSARTEERLRIQERSLAERLDTAAQRTQETAGAIQQRLAVIDAAQASITALGGQVTSLAAILGNKQARGALGEVQLRDLITDRLPAQGFRWQHTLSNGTRCDCLVILPFPPGPIAVDAKFPLEAWSAWQDAPTQTARDLARRRFANDVRRHVSDIARKYLLPGETAEGALMFVPSEAVHATLHAELPELVAEAARRHVHIVGPSTLWAVLNTMRGLLRDARLQEEARRIRAEVEALAEETARLERRVAALRTHHAAMGQDMREIETSAEKIARRGEAIRALDIPDDTPMKAAE
ncbi:DNA recombination protein RmuC [Falsiroseomonas bella]|uniref:DNA recombination protein RmuC homolog n=1 Tax=Falsiroseomonas bella TaxID=2184016 RepID=A0A317FLM4_9PROT|nr:DNA recombination protein RmuC [Falsiroseomonas bella]PWS38486.1 DNA recombination protein RmuC [Falsiroseomonas bella]